MPSLFQLLFKLFSVLRLCQACAAYHPSSSRGCLLGTDQVNLEAKPKNDLLAHWQQYKPCLWVFYGQGIVLLHLPPVSPLACILEQFVVAGVHRLPAGLPMACNLKYLLSGIMTGRHEERSLLRAALASVTLLKSGLLLLACGHRYYLCCQMLQPFSPPETGDGARAQFQAHCLLCSRCYISSTGAFWQLSWRQDVVLCCIICFQRPA